MSEELRRAADRLDSAAEARHKPFRSPAGPAAMDPHVGKALAAWLRDEANLTDTPLVSTTHALVVARAVNREAT